MTARERETDRKLREELKMKRNAEDAQEGTAFVIRKGRVVRIERAEEDKRNNNGSVGGARPKVRENVGNFRWGRLGGYKAMGRGAVEGYPRVDSVGMQERGNK